MSFKEVIMYNNFFGFREHPFNVTPDPKIFYVNSLYQRTYANLLYAISEGKGVTILTGEAGTGKTTLLRCLMENFEDTVRFAYCPYPTLSFAELVDFVCDDLELPQKSHGQVQKFEALHQFLIVRQQQKQYCALLIDEAHNLRPSMLSQLVQLADLAAEGKQLLPIVLVGQPDLDVTLSHPMVASLKQRVTGLYQLDRLKKDEVGPFIFHRLSAVGCNRLEIFPPDVVQDIAEYSQGIPRYINTICDNALIIACREAKNSVTKEIIEEVARDLQLSVARCPEPESSTSLHQVKYRYEGTIPELLRQQPSVFDTLPSQREKSPMTRVSWFFSQARRQLTTGVGLCVGGFLLFLLSFQLPLPVATKPETTHRPPLASDSAQVPLPLPPLQPPTPVITQTQALPSPEHTKEHTAADSSERTTHQITIATVQSLPIVGEAEKKKTSTAPQPDLLPIEPPDQANKIARSFSPGENLAQEQQRQEKNGKKPFSAHQQALLTPATSGSPQREDAQQKTPRTKTSRDEKRTSPLMLAVMHGHTDVVQELLKNGADVNEYDASGRTALMVAALTGRTPILQTLLSNGASVNVQNTEGWTALMYAAWNGHTKIVRTLVSNGAKVETKNSTGGTAFTNALHNGHKETARLLRTGLTE